MMNGTDVFLPLSFWLGTAFKGSIVLLVAWGGLRLLRPRSAAHRHLVWVLALVALVALPVLSLSLPTWRALPAVAAVERLAETSATPSAPTPATLSPAIDIDASVPAVSDRAFETQAARSAAAGAAPWPTPEVGALAGMSAEAAPAAEGLGSAALSLLQSRTAWATFVWFTWMVGFIGWMLWSFAGLLKVHRIGRLASSVVPARWRQDLDGAREALGVKRSVRLLRSDRVAVPVTWGLFRPVVALPVEAGTWSAAQVRQALLHEVAHIKRLDQPLMIIAQWACALHWCNPLAWFGLRELRRNCELATDDLVLASGVRASDYAASLVAVARSIRSGNGLPAAAFAMARSSDLGGRVDAILDPEQSRRGATRFDVLAILIIAAGFITPLAALATRIDGPQLPPEIHSAPVVWAPPSPPPPHPLADATAEPELHTLAEALAESEYLLAEARSSLSELTEDFPEPHLSEPELALRFERLNWANRAQEMPCFDRDRRITGDQVEVNESGMRAYWRTEACSWTVRIAGEVHFTADERSVRSLTPGGSLLILQEGQGPDRHYRVTEKDGDLEVIYQLGGDDQSLADAESWLGFVVPELHRVTGIDRDIRIARLLRVGGPPAVLKEVTQIRSGYVSRQYLETLLRNGDLSSADVAELLRIAENRIDSDYEMRKLLTAAAFDIRSDEVRVAYLDAARSIDSDFELRTALESFFANRVTSEEADVIITLAARIRSDFELRELLGRTSREAQLSEQNLESLFEAVADIASDFEMREAVNDVLDQSALRDGHLIDFMDRIEDMESDFERAELMRAIVAARTPLSPALADRLIEALDVFDSEHERDRTRAAVNGGVR